MKKEERLPLGTIVYLDGADYFLGMIDSYTIIDNKLAYRMAATLLTVSDSEVHFDWNSNDEDGWFIFPAGICEEAAQEDAQKFYNEIMNK